MSIRNPNWYDANEQRSWPLDELATHASTTGDRIPYDLLIDMNLQFPTTMGTYAYIGSITVGPRLVTMTIISDMGVTLAVVNIPEADKWRHYPIESDYSGVGGWVVFGTGIIQTEGLSSYIFDGLSSSKLMPKVARSYTPRSTGGLGKKSVDQLLSGVVKLEGGNDIEVVKETREIEGKVIDAIVVRLRDKQSATGSRSIFSDYIGDCETRPESQNCAGNLPIEFINSVQPDCDGNIVIEFRGCANMTIDEGGCGVVVDCGLSLSDVCVTADYLPDADGRLPSDYDGDCIDVSISIITDPPSDSLPAGVPEIEYDPEPCTAEQMASLPYTADFSSQLIPAEMSIVQGEGHIQYDNQPASFGGYSLVLNGFRDSVASYLHTSKGVGTLAIFPLGAIFTDAAWKCICRKIDVWLVLKEGNTTTAKRNAGVVFNYRESPTILGNYEYWQVNLDADLKTFSLKHYNASNLLTLATVAFPNIKIRQQYQVTIEVLSNESNNQSWVTATVTNSLSPSSLGATATVTITDFTALNTGDKVNLIATDGTNYDFVSGSHSSVAGTWEATTSNEVTATSLMNVINTSSGPAGTRFSASVVGAVITITQNTIGEAGNTAVTLTDSGAAGMTSTNFVDGATANPDYVNLTIGPMIADNYNPNTGHIGFAARQSEVDFNKIIVDNTTP